MTAPTHPATAPDLRAQGLDTSRAHPARVYAAWLGADKDTFAADRDAATRIAQKAPWVVAGARDNRAFLRRAVAYLARQGITSYLDIGSGLPIAGNVHEIAQRHQPEARVAYLDNDPVVLAHARALLACDHRTIAVPGDARHPHAILTDPAIRAHLDFDRPVAVLLVAVAHFLDGDQPARTVAAIREALPMGSYVVISHVADLPEASHETSRATATREAADLYNDLAAPLTLRTPDQITALLGGLELVPPGLVPADHWRPRRKHPGPPVPILAAVGRTPGSPWP
jgi:hypothetical protein